MMTPLNEEERARFAAWLEWEANTDDMLVAEMERVDSPFTPERRKDAEAKRRVARQLRQTQEFGLT